MVLSSLAPSMSILEKFEECTSEELYRTIMASQSKLCELDPLPTSVVKKFLPDILPFMVDMCNASIRQGNLTVSQRHAIITPRLKKVNADGADVKNYTPISNLTYASKLVERLVCRQLVDF